MTALLEETEKNRRIDRVLATSFWLSRSAAPEDGAVARVIPIVP